MKSILTNLDRELKKLEKHLDAIAPAIGYLVFSFNSLENTLDTILIEFISDDVEEVGAAVIDGMTFHSKVNLLGKLYHVMLAALEDDVFGERLKDLLSSLDQAAEMRNSVVHAAWLEYNTATRTVRTKRKVTKRGLEVLEKPLSKKDIKKCQGFIESVEYKLTKFQEEMNNR